MVVVVLWTDRHSINLCFLAPFEREQHAFQQAPKLIDLSSEHYILVLLLYHVLTVYVFLCITNKM